MISSTPSLVCDLIQCMRRMASSHAALSQSRQLIEALGELIMCLGNKICIEDCSNSRRAKSKKRYSEVPTPSSSSASAQYQPELKRSVIHWLRGQSRSELQSIFSIVDTSLVKTIISMSITKRKRYKCQQFVTEFRLSPSVTALDTNESNSRKLNRKGCYTRSDAPRYR